MLALSKVTGALVASPLRIAAMAPLQLRFLSQNRKTNALKTKEKSKLRRQRISKTDKPAQAKRGVRVSKL